MIAVGRSPPVAAGSSAASAVYTQITKRQRVQKVHGHYEYADASSKNRRVTCIHTQWLHWTRRMQRAHFPSLHYTQTRREAVFLCKVCFWASVNVREPHDRTLRLSSRVWRGHPAQTVRSGGQLCTEFQGLIHCLCSIHRHREKWHSTPARACGGCAYER